MIRARWLMVVFMSWTWGAGLAFGDAAPSAPADVKPVKIRPKFPPLPERGETGLNAPETDLIDTPTAAVLDYGGYASQTRAYAAGGVLEYASFGVYPRIGLGASMSVDGLIGNDRSVRVRAPQLQVKYRFFDGDRYIPAFALGFDGQGFDYSQTEKIYHNRQRGFYVVGTQELGLAGLQVHPSFNISDFNSNSIFGSVPVSYNIKDKATVMFEWDNIGRINDSRVNSGLRVHLTPGLHIDFAVRGIGKGGWYPDGAPRGPERVIQMKYTGNF